MQKAIKTTSNQYTLKLPKAKVYIEPEWMTKYRIERNIISKLQGNESDWSKLKYMDNVTDEDIQLVKEKYKL